MAKHSLSSGARCVSGGRATETQVNFASRCSVGTPSGGRFSGFPNGRPVRVNVTSLLVLIGDYGLKKKNGDFLVCSFPVLVYRLGVVLCVWLIRARTFKCNRVKLCDSTSAIQVFYRVKAPFSSCCLDESLNMTCFVCQVVSKFYLIHSLTP